MGGSQWAQGGECSQVSCGSPQHPRLWLRPATGETSREPGGVGSGAAADGCRVASGAALLGANSEQGGPQSSAAPDAGWRAHMQCAHTYMHTRVHTRTHPGARTGEQTDSTHSRADAEAEAEFVTLNRTRAARGAPGSPPKHQPHLPAAPGPPGQPQPEPQAQLGLAPLGSRAPDRGGLPSAPRRDPVCRAGPGVSTLGATGPEGRGGSPGGARAVSRGQDRNGRVGATATRCPQHGRDGTAPPGADGSPNCLWVSITRL